MNYLSQFVTQLSEAVGQPGNIVMAIICIVAGLFMCFFGRRLLKPALGIAGFVAGTLLGKVALETAHNALSQKDELFGLNNDFAKAAPFVSGVVTGVICMNLVQIAMYMLAAAGGVVSFVVVKDALQEGVGFSLHPYVRAGIMVAVAVVPVVLVSFVENIVVGIATAIIGSSLILMGVDIFVQKGFMTSLKHFWQIRESGVENIVNEAKNMLQDKNVSAMCAGFVVVALVGSLYQINFGKSKDA